MPLAVAANEIIIGGLSHSSSTAAWQSGWLFGDGAVAAAVAVTVAGGGGGCIPPSLGDRRGRRRGCERVTGERCLAAEEHGPGDEGGSGGRGEMADEEEEEEEEEVG